MNDDLSYLERLVAQREILKVIVGRSWNSPIDKLEELIGLHLDAMIKSHTPPAKQETIITSTESST